MLTSIGADKNAPLTIKETLAFLESDKVQRLLIEAFMSSHSRGQREAIRKHGFWKYASGAVKDLGRRTAQVVFLNDLYTGLKQQKTAPDETQGTIRFDRFHLKADEDGADMERLLPRVREKLQDKFDRAVGPLSQLTIDSVEIEKQNGYRLSLYSSGAIAEAVRSRVGRPSKERGEYPDDAILRRNLLIRQSAPLPVPRKAVDDVVAEFIRDEGLSTLILPGSCHAGKTRWMLDYNDRHSTSVIFYAFDRVDKDILSESIFCRHMAEKLAAICTIPKNTKRIGTIDSLVKLLALLSGLHNRLAKVRPVVMIDALDEAGSFANDLVEFMTKSWAQELHGLRYVFTIRTPTDLLSRLQTIPQSITQRVFDERKTVIEFMEGWLRMANIARPPVGANLKSVYEKSGSNLQLAIQLLSAVKGDGYAKKTRRGLY